MILDEAFINYVCSCESCAKVFNKIKKHFDAIENMPDEEKKLLNNLEGNLNDDEEEKEEAKDSTAHPPLSSSDRKVQAILNE